MLPPTSSFGLWTTYLAPPWTPDIPLETTDDMSPETDHEPQTRNFKPRTTTGYSMLEAITLLNHVEGISGQVTLLSRRTRCWKVELQAKYDVLIKYERMGARVDEERNRRQLQ